MLLLTDLELLTILILLALSCAFQFVSVLLYTFYACSTFVSFCIHEWEPRADLGPTVLYGFIFIFGESFLVMNFNMEFLDLLYILSREAYSSYFYGLSYWGPYCFSTLLNKSFFLFALNEFIYLLNLFNSSLFDEVIAVFSIGDLFWSW